jgi:elongation factor G
MNIYDSSRIRNLVLLGHSGSGKTTLAETMLFESGTIQRRGSVQEGNTVSDFHAIEKDKQKSVFSSFMTLDWRGHKINLIDTPGTLDYSGEVIGALKVAGTSIFVLDAERGVEVGTEILWKQAAKYNSIPLFVVNKIDHPKSNFDRTVEMARERFGRQVVPVQYPYSEGEDFHAIIDVLKMTMYEFPESGGKPEKLPIPDSQKDRAELMHNELIEIIAENDESLMDIYFEKGNLDEDELIEGLKSCMLQRQVFPLFCVSAQRNMGSGRVMGFIDAVAPSPLDIAGPTLDSGEVFTLDPAGKTSVFVFKSHAEEHVGDLMFFKVYSGSVKPGMDLYNASSGNANRLTGLFASQGGKRLEVSELRTGDIGAVVKLKDAGPGDTLNDKGLNLKFEPIKFPEPTIRMAVKSTRQGDEDKIGQALYQLHKEDPSLYVEQSQELKQIIIGGQGEEHLAVIQHSLESRFKLGVEFIDPKIPYRETITRPVKAHYKHKKQSGGAGQYGEVYLYIEPWYEGMPPPPEITVRDTQEFDLPWGGKLVYLNSIVGGVIDARFLPAILKGVMDKMENGPLSGCRCRDIRVAVYDGSMHSVDSNEAAFKTAGLMAFKNGFLDAAPQLLEPVYDVDVFVPADYMGDVMSDLSTRRGQIQGMDSEGSLQTIKAKVPLSELNRYYTHLKSMTQGRATYQMQFSGYAPVPREIQEKIMKENIQHDDHT